MILPQAFVNVFYGLLELQSSSNTSRIFAASVWSFLSCFLSDRCFIRNGQVNLESCPIAGLAVNPDIAVVLFDDAVDRGQSQAGAALAFGGKKRFENLFAGFFIHTLSRIADGQHGIRHPDP